ncbi:hypothetical protein CDAR_238981 [Caerostris darwini]|uniref:Secreted protein n=1 Tax=Caerostris darwini TaxID=1538125 RepID=A0AAV4PQI0_9ARAC|nr:hypothetical protein CDAR_238981 [Caerostris darwini]
MCARIGSERRSLLRILLCHVVCPFLLLCPTSLPLPPPPFKCSKRYFEEWAIFDAASLACHFQKQMCFRITLGNKQFQPFRIDWFRSQTSWSDSDIPIF